ncbi:hypothetical protein [Aliivibrio fischeri]|uniref:hypothetical protein n=1 Tax=Aliivibrio fischeri TaxID=668 RepID=UPI0007C4A424|nr:hypothetical protein [Aliivibrio fischeri]
MIGKYWIYEKETKEVNQIGLDACINTKMPEYPRDSLTVKPLVDKDGFAVIACDFDDRGKPHSTKYVSDFRNRNAYSKDRDQTKDYLITEIGEILQTHTLIEPKEFDSWNEEKNIWEYDINRESPVKYQIEKEWRDETLLKVINRMEQYNQDNSLPSNLKCSPINESQFFKLASDRVLLCDYTKKDNFPFCTRPKLSGVLDEI